MIPDDAKSPGLWRVLPGIDLHWRSWETESVVYHAASGDTHLLNPLAAQALRFLSSHAATVDETTRHVAAGLELQVDDELLRKMRQCFDRFIEMGLIEPAHAASGSAHT